MAIELKPNALIDADQETRDFLVGGVADKDDLLKSLINAVSEAVTSPDGVNGPVLEEAVTKKRDGNDKDCINVYPGPFRAIDSVTVAGVVLDPSEYEFEDWSLYRLNGEVWPAGRRNIVIVYKAGICADMAHVPEDIRDAVRMQIKHILTAVVEGRSQYDPETASQDPRQYSLTPAVRHKLERYRP